MRKFLPRLWDLPRFSPFKSSKPMAESRCHGNCLTAWLMEWSRDRPFVRKCEVDEGGAPEPACRCTRRRVGTSLIWAAS